MNSALHRLSPEDQAIFRELDLRRGALDSLDKFREFMEPSGHIDMLHPHEKHHKVMARAFEKVERGEIKQLMICLPPASAKSTLTIQFVLWHLARNPHHNILRVSATQSLSERFARRIRSAIQEPLFQRLSGATLSSDEQSVSSFATTKGGSVVSAGALTSIIGLRSNLSIIDDPVASWESAHSETQRQAQIDWYFSEYRSRLVPGAPEIIVSTRWHRFDLCGTVLAGPEADTWEYIRIPMLCDDPENDPLQREMGQRLWPAWFTPQMVEENQRDPERWSGMFQQTPLTSEGDFLSPNDIEIVDSAPEGLGINASLDLALSEKQSADATVVIIAGMDHDGTLYLLDLFEGRISSEQVIEQLVGMHHEWNYRECLVEDSPAEKVFRTLAHKMLRERNKIIPLTQMPTRGRDKMTRAQAFRGLCKMGSVKMVRGSWNTTIIQNITEFPFGRHDDVVDALALLGQRASRMGSTTKSKPVQKDIIQGLQVIDGRQYTNSTLDELWSDNKSRHTGILRL